MLALIDDLDHRHIADEVDGTDIDLDNLHAEALLEVGLELVAFFRGDEVDAIVLDEPRRLQLQVALDTPSAMEFTSDRAMITKR